MARAAEEEQENRKAKELELTYSHVKQIDAN
jgi:hypothetical protein